MLKVVHDADASNHNSVAGGSLLDEIVRDGARAMLAAALQAEVAAYIDAHAGEVDETGHRLVVRNGFHQPREVVTAAGAVPVRAPRVNEKRLDEISAKTFCPSCSRGSRSGTASCSGGPRSPTSTYGPLTPTWADGGINRCGTRARLASVANPAH